MSERRRENVRVAIVGATGLVGREILSLLNERGFPVGDLHLYGSDRSEGEEIEFRGRAVRSARLLRELPTLDVAFLCATEEVSRSRADDFVDAGAMTIDLTPAHRRDPDVPLLVAGAVLPEGSGGMLVAVPDALTSLLATPLRTLDALSPLKRVVATALVSASAFGSRSVDELGRATIRLLNAQEEPEDDQTTVSAFNSRPLTEAESEARRFGVEDDLRRLLLAAAIPVTVTVVRTPSFHGHAASVSVELSESVSLDQLRLRLRDAPSIVLEDGPAIGTRDSVGSEGMLLGRLRLDDRDPRWVHFWVSADNLRQGAALNAVALAEALLRTRHVS